LRELAYAEVEEITKECKSDLNNLKSDCANPLDEFKQDIKALDNIEEIYQNE
jgi:hypothetical protein